MFRDNPSRLSFPFLVTLPDFDIPSIDLSLGTFWPSQIGRYIQTSVPLFRQVVPVVMQLSARLFAEDWPEVSATETALPDDFPVNGSINYSSDSRADVARSLTLETCSG